MSCKGNVILGYLESIEKQKSETMCQRCSIFFNELYNTILAMLLKNIKIMKLKSYWTTFIKTLKPARKKFVIKYLRFSGKLIAEPRIILSLVIHVLGTYIWPQCSWDPLPHLVHFPHYNGPETKKWTCKKTIANLLHTY